MICQCFLAQILNLEHNDLTLAGDVFNYNYIFDSF